jgi:hypothetical protein
MGRNSIGVDVDPLAIEVATAKTRQYDIDRVESACKELLDRIDSIERPHREYVKRQHADISERAMRAALRREDLWVPAIPRLEHWFRRYVIVDLARILAEVMSLAHAEPSVYPFLRLVFASIIRNSSNADPVPVSGLEYTSHMRRRDAEGRVVNSFSLLRTALARALRAVSDYARDIPQGLPEPAVRRGSAMNIDQAVDAPVDAVITSPPYQNAVDYYRRHQLESFWLGHVQTQSERERAIPDYIGRPHIAQKDPVFKLEWKPRGMVAKWENRIAAEAPGRASDFRHYCISMGTFFDRLANVLEEGSPVVMVVGHSSWKGVEIPTAALLAELANGFTLSEVLHYPVKNRYMSYARHNKASIDKEYVLVFRK